MVYPQVRVSSAAGLPAKSGRRIMETEVYPLDRWLQNGKKGRMNEELCRVCWAVCATCHAVLGRDRT